MKIIFYLRYVQQYTQQELAEILKIPRTSLVRYENFTTIMPGNIILKIYKIKLENDF